MEKKINVYLMFTITFLQGFVFYGPIATLYRQSRGLSMYNIFLIESIFMILMLVFEIPWGWFADKFGYKPTLIISNLLFFISKIVFYKANSFPLFLIERILVALAISGISGCDIALLYSSIDKDKSEKVFGIYTALNSAGFLVASIFSTFMIEKSMSLTAFYTILPYGIALILTFFLKGEFHKPEIKPSIKESIKEVIDSKRIIIAVIAVSLMGEVAHSIVVFLNQSQYLRSGIAIKYFGLLTALMQLICLISARTYKFTERFGQKRTSIVLLISIFASCIALVYTKNPIISVLTIAVIQGSYAMSQPIILDIENKSIRTQNRATVLSMYAMVGDIIASVANVSIGKFADISITTAFNACAVISGIACIFIFIYFSQNIFFKKTIKDIGGNNDN